MHNADLIFTSAGRTMYEIASLGVPCICLCQNERELTHIFGNTEHGFINLGLGSNLSKETIIRTFENTIDDYELRLEMNKRMGEVDLRHGFDNIKKLIKKEYKKWKKSTDNKSEKKNLPTRKKNDDENLPVWFNHKQDVTELSHEEEEELDKLLNELI